MQQHSKRCGRRASARRCKLGARGGGGARGGWGAGGPGRPPGRARWRAQVGFEDLKAATDKRYYKFRSQQLLHLDDPNMCAARAALNLLRHATDVLGPNIAAVGSHRFGARLAC